MILGSGAEEGDPPDVNLLDGGGEGAVGFRGLEDEGIEVAYDEGDGGDRVGRQFFEIRRDVAREDAWELRTSGSGVCSPP